MTVAEYIESLKAMPQDAIVLARHYENGWHEAGLPGAAKAFKHKEDPGSYTGLYVCPVVDEMAIDDNDLESEWCRECWNLDDLERVNGKVVVIQ